MALLSDTMSNMWQVANMSKKAQKSWTLGQKNRLLRMIFFFHAMYSSCSKDSKNAIKTKNAKLFFLLVIFGTPYLRFFNISCCKKLQMLLGLYNILIFDQHFINISPKFCQTTKVLHLLQNRVEHGKKVHWNSKKSQNWPKQMFLEPVLALCIMKV